jgi:hypothetical protein
MAAWSDDDLERIGRAGEWRVAGRRRDGTLRKLVIIWGVRVGDSLYVRSVNGPDAAWFRGTQLLGDGQIGVDGVSYEVSFVPDAELREEIDDAYRRKYGSGSSVRAINAATAGATTLRVDPR